MVTGAVVRSFFKVDAPAEVYQTNVLGKVQDSSSLLQLVIALAPQMADALSATLAAHRGAAPLMTKLMDVNDDAARQSPVLSKVIVPTLRRFDGREIEVYNPATDAMEVRPTVCLVCLSKFHLLPHAPFLAGLAFAPRGCDLLSGGK
jgi:hypothetical protein